MIVQIYFRRTKYLVEVLSGVERFGCHGKVTRKWAATMRVSRQRHGTRALVLAAAVSGGCYAAGAE